MTKAKPKAKKIKNVHAGSNGFHKTTWAKVEKGDVALMAWQSLREIVEIEIAEVTRETFHGAELVLVSFDYAGDRYPRWSFNPKAVAYVRSRL